MNFITTGIESLGIKLITIGSHRQGRSDILFLRVGTSHVEDNLVGRASVRDIKFLDFDGRVRHTQVKTICAEGIGGQSRYNTQTQQGPDEGPHIETS